METPFDFGNANTWFAASVVDPFPHRLDRLLLERQSRIGDMESFNLGHRIRSRHVDNYCLDT